MFCINIADLIIAIDNKYSYVESLCNAYKCNSHHFDFCVMASDEEIVTERNATDSTLSDDFIESVCIYRNIAKRLPAYNAFVMHGAAIEYKGKAICFTAKSGTGKTTHIKLWRKYFGSDVNIINGDKPIIRLKDDSFYVYGSPWSGKENYNSNINAPLKSICFIQQDKNNSIDKLDFHQSLNLMLPQIFLIPNPDITNKTVDLIGKMLSNTDCWKLYCDISEEAARTSFNAITKRVLM